MGRGLAAGALAVALLAPLAGRADSLSLQVEPAYSGNRTTSTDATGNLTRLDGTEFRQRYRLTFDTQPFPLVRLSGNGLYDWALGWQKASAGWTDLDTRRWNGGLRLDMGGPALRGGAQYDVRQQSAESRTGGVKTPSPTLEQRTATVFAAWRAEGLPSLDLRFSRTDAFDLSRSVADSLTDDGSLLSRWRVAEPLELRANLLYHRERNRLTGVTQTDSAAQGRVQYADTLAAGRLSLYLTYDAQRSITDVAVSGAGGLVLERRLAAAGLSLVEGLPATPARSTLAASPALLDGDTAAAAGLDIGFGPSLGGDVRERQAGARFADAVTDVNTLHLWVDQQLPAAVASAFTFTVWRSDDNLDWTPVSPAGPAVFALLQNRFEIPIATTRARYLKVVTRPLLTAVTTDTRYQAIRITELQFFLASPAESKRGSQAQGRGSLSTGAKLLLLREANLAYDTSLYLVHGTGRPTTWDVVNGLSASQRLARVLVGTARLERADSQQSAGREHVWRYTATLAADPLPALGGLLSYGGEQGRTAAGPHDNNTFLANLRADLYQGVSALANASYAFGTRDTGQGLRALNAGGSLQVAPGSYLALGGSYLLQQLTTLSSAAGAPDTTVRLQRLEALGSFTPIPALYLSLGVARVITQEKAYNLGSLAANVTPFPGGTLLLRFGYQESYDGGADTRTRLWGPSLRWNVRPGSYLDASYTDTTTRTPALETRSRALFASLLVTL